MTNNKTITLIGLGIRQPANLSETARQRLKAAKNIFVKTPHFEILTQIPASAKYLSPTINPIDQTTDGCQTFAAQLVDAAPSVYLLPGDPLIDEASLPVIRQAAEAAGAKVKLINAPDMLSPTLRALDISAGAGLQILDAEILCSYHHPPLEPDRPALITGLYHAALLPLLETRLKAIYSPDAEVRAVTFQDDEGRRTKDEAAQTENSSLVIRHSSFTLRYLPAKALPKPASAAYLYIPPQPAAAGLTRFQETIAHLRAPNGCPWDREQTHQSLRPYLLEETHEVLTALDANDLPHLAEELGDLLLQIALHAQIAGEAGSFQMKDIIHNINAKIIRRHPHVFGSAITVGNSDEVKAIWATVKAAEKAENGNGAEPPSVLDGAPPTLAALAQTLNISQKAVDVGFEWQDTEGVLEKLVEEAREITEAATPAEVESELGDFLFTAVNLARKLKVDPETALRETNLRFTRRFKKVEALAREQTLVLTELTAPEWKLLWDQAKEAVAHLERK
ncbi:MAG TPA: nucleoside triphosphate pyrophosphohydrolase [Chloroflexi bacterium]|nr:nucleoside triphosphate pyrophosphohydrolase [Chloroflexota bacterium]